jgi:hypothetical protein
MEGMMNFSLESYAPVQERIGEFYREFPHGCIQTRLVREDGPEVVFEARIYRSPEEVAARVYTSGWAREIEGKNPVNRSSHLENCESSAIGRALANLGYSKDARRPCRSEMIKVHRVRREHEAMLEFIREVGARSGDELEVRLDGELRNLKLYLRENWQPIKEQFRLARTVVDAVEACTGQQFKAAA